MFTGKGVGVGTTHPRTILCAAHCPLLHRHWGGLWLWCRLGLWGYVCIPAPMSPCHLRAPHQERPSTPWAWVLGVDVASVWGLAGAGAWHLVRSTLMPTTLPPARVPPTHCSRFNTFSNDSPHSQHPWLNPSHRSPTNKRFTFVVVSPSPLRTLE